MAVSIDCVEGGKPAPHDVFLSYHTSDRGRVAAIRNALSDRGVRVFLDRHDLAAGLPWPEALEKTLRSVRAVVVFVGHGDDGESLGRWQRREVWFALDRQAQVERQGPAFPVIPVLLPGSRPDASFLFLNTWVDLRDQADEATAIDAIVRAVDGTAAGPAERVAVALCPYRALEVFREEHAALFFGRESFAADLLERATHRSLVALVGPSGSGKSSVVQAGLVPLLRRQRPPQRAWDVVLFRPGDNPFHRLAAALIPLLEPDADEVDRLALGRKLGDTLAEGAVRLEDIVNRVIAKSNGTDQLLLVADQFEEVFTLASSERRQFFVSAVLDALDRAPFKFLLTLRADFYGHAVALDRRLSDLIQTGLVNLGPMTRDELRRAIEQPAQRAAIQFEPGLVDRVLDHVELQPGGLPLLEFALTQLWERRDGPRITHAAYEAIGEVAGAISRRAEAVFLGLEAERQRAALGLFTRLLRVASPGEAEPETRRRVELATLTESERLVLKPFVEARLLVLGSGESGATQTVEVAHEALIHGWGRLAEWVTQQRQFLLWRQRVGQSLAAWETAGRDKGALLRGPALKEALGWMREHRSDVSPAEADFIERSRKRAWRRRCSRGAAIGLIALLALALPGIWLGARTNTFQVWGAIHVAPMWFTPLPSPTAAWIHAVDVAGRLDAVGQGIFKFPLPAARLQAVESAAVVIADEGRPAEADRLAERALAIARDLSTFDSNPFDQMQMAAMLSQVGRDESARPFARRAFTLMREIADPEGRAVGLATLAHLLARVGLPQEARTAIDEARAALPEGSPPEPRAEVDQHVAQALVRLGSVDKALQFIPRRSGWPLVALTQVLIDGGYLEQARELVGRSDEPFALAVVASALVSANRRDEGRALVVTALDLVQRGPGPPRYHEDVRTLLQDRLLLRVMTADEGASFFRKRKSAIEIANFAAVLARTGHADLARQMAVEAAKLAKDSPSLSAPGRVLVKVAEALAHSGDAERALTTARAIEERELQPAGVAHAAFGFAAKGERGRAQALVQEVRSALRSIRDPDQRSLTWGALAIASVRLGRYAEALDDDGLAVDPRDRVLVYAAVIRDDVLRRHPERRDAFDRGPVQGLGRFGVYWP